MDLKCNTKLLKYLSSLSNFENTMFMEYLRVPVEYSTLDRAFRMPADLRFSDDDDDSSPRKYVSFHERPAIFPFSKVDLVQHAAE
ncbi:hypothetical protein ALC56_00823 [Trachymyrmex septentrionalis]|uniref:Uncharacterized protein n=1 Tax=Trachymyrmex septentrionalis TaxID=34720 RepID=A0A195FWK3_9HYME|nr:hypothetical protein ALC56_00823 [Trachymyrmex septentrionalis]